LDEPIAQRQFVATIDFTFTATPPSLICPPILPADQLQPIFLKKKKQKQNKIPDSKNNNPHSQVPIFTEGNSTEQNTSSSPLCGRFVKSIYPLPVQTFLRLILWIVVPQHQGHPWTHEAQYVFLPDGQTENLPFEGSLYRKSLSPKRPRQHHYQRRKKPIHPGLIQ
jgi:hypothetical protein